MFENEKKEYSISFHCCYETRLTRHHQIMALSDIPRWISAYQFTHPDVQSISAKVWLVTEECDSESTTIV